MTLLDSFNVVFEIRGIDEQLPSDRSKIAAKVPVPKWALDDPLVVADTGEYLCVMLGKVEQFEGWEATKREWTGRTYDEATLW